MDRISEHISYKEATKSYTAVKYGIDNNVYCYCIEDNMKRVAQRIFEPLRSYYGRPIGIASFYRSKKLNKRIGGSKNSQHLFGEAVDLDADMYGFINNSQIFNYIYRNLDYDQLVWEHGNEEEPDWVHVSYVSTEDNRNEALVAYKKGNKTKYRYYEG